MSHPHRPQPGPLGDPPADNDPLTANGGTAGVWSLPSIGPGVLEVPAALPPSGYDYGAGIIEGAGAGLEADGIALSSPHLIRLRTNEPRAFELPHEATHRRNEPPRIAVINQAAAGFLKIASPNQGLHYIKILSAFITLDAAGTLKFVQGSEDGTSVADLSGLFALGGAAVPPLQLQPAPIETPWFFTSSDLALGIFTVTGKAQGFLTYCYSPYDS